MNNTDKYGFYRPEREEGYSIAQQNENWEKTETILQEHQEAQEQIQEKIQDLFGDGLTLTDGQLAIIAQNLSPEQLISLAGGL